MDFFKTWEAELKQEIWKPKEGESEEDDYTPSWWETFADAFSETEVVFGERKEEWEEKEEEYREIEKKLPDELADVTDEYEKKIFKKMQYLTKSNLLLRKGQTKDEYFFDPENLYDEAAILLEQVFEPDQYNPLDLMIKLNLGKYFRNKGKHGRRSNYWRALDEFKEIRFAIEKHKGGEQLCGWETHLWLEAMANIGRSYRYLYQLEIAETYFLRLCFLTGNDDIIDDFFSEDENELNGIIIDHSKAPGKDSAKKTAILELREDDQSRLCTNSTLFRSYFLQSGIQLGITYQKGRDYDRAKKVFQIVKKVDPKNFDAKINLSLLERKGVKTEKRKADGGQRISGLERAMHSFNRLKDQNRFARINYWKCRVDLWRQEKPSLNFAATEKEPGRELEEVCRKYPNDLELKLILARYYQVKSRWNGSMEPEFRSNYEMWEKSQELFREIYKKSPYVRKGTIGLKAYYNMVQDLIIRKRFHEAKKALNWILKECDEKLPEAEVMEPKIGIFQDSSFGQSREFPTEISLGWCLINLGEYEEAIKIYEGLQEEEEQKEYLKKTYNRMGMLNNLGECYLRLEKPEEAEKCFDKVLKKERDNVVANRYMGHCLSLQAECQAEQKEEKRDKKEQIKLRNEAEEKFQKVILSKPDDIYLNAGWVINRLKLWELQDESGKKELFNSIENTILYSSQRFSMEAVFGMAEFIEAILEKSKNTKNGKSDMGDEMAGKGEEDKEDTKHKKLLRALARIRLGKREEGYNAFRNFQDQEDFRKLPSEIRGEVLLHLFKLYHVVLEIKRQCRLTLKNFQKEDGQKEEPQELLLPVHYTKIEVLRLLLSKDPEKPGKLRLWNMAYMNDSYEGNTFLELLKKAGEKKEMEKEDGNEKAVQEILPRYFHYLDNSFSKVLPGHGNVYIASFSKQQDSIPMWNTYADNAKGCVVTFAEEFFDIRSNSEERLGVSVYSDEDYPLYEVQYWDEIGKDEWKGKEEAETNKKGKQTEICNSIKEIWNQLQKLEGLFAREVTKKEKAINEAAADAIREFAADRINEIRFLFKNREYEHERELRLVRYSHQPLVDEENKNFDVPRLYVEVEKDIHMKTVCLGSKVDPNQEERLVTWLYHTGKVDNVKRSQRHYR